MTTPDLPRVSVLMTAYNRAQFIGAAIESVLGQTFTDFELVIVDDCSTDDTVAVARRYLRDSRVRLFVNEVNRGDYPNRNYAATLARGTFLKFHDSDDVMYPHCLEVIVRALESEPTAAFALSGSRGWPGGPAPMLLSPGLSYEREFLGSGLFNLGPAAALFRTAAFADLGGFPERGVASDYLFWLRACARVNVVLAPADLFYYRVHAGQELARAGSRDEYVQTRSAAWTILHSCDCPLHGDRLALARRNFVFTVVRGAYRRARCGDLRGAFHDLMHGGPRLFDLVRYCGWPHRFVAAGTPAPSESSA